MKTLAIATKFLVLTLVTAESLSPIRYVIASSPESGGVFYWRSTSVLTTTAEEVSKMTPTSDAVADTGANAPTVLVSGLQAPMGVAVDQARGALYVADTTAHKIYKYKIEATSKGCKVVGDQIVAVRNVAVRWIAVDGSGNLFYSVEGDGLIQKVEARKLRSGEATPATIYDASTVAEVSSPGGLAVDNFRLFWGNKASGTEVGSVAQGYETPNPDNPRNVMALATNVNKVYGVCLSSNNVYYTEGEGNLYGTKKFGGAIVVVNDKLKEPRGCAWDGDGTIYVADKAGGMVYAFPANMQTLAPQKLFKAFELAGPVSVAVITADAYLRLAIFSSFAYLLL